MESKKLHTTTCQQCAHVEKSLSEKVCQSCGLLAKVREYVLHTRSCQACHAEFAPLAPRDSYCGRCVRKAKSPLASEERCLLCGNLALCYSAKIQVCYGCLLTPAKRLRILDWLHRWQINRALKTHSHLETPQGFDS